VNTNYVVVARSGGGRRFAAAPVPDALTAKYRELFTSGEPVLITPFKEQIPRRGPEGRGFRFGGNRRGPPRSAVQRTNQWGPPPGDVTLMQMAAPIREESGAMLGALALVINPEREFSRILSSARRGESGESYAFDQDGLMISRSRFDETLAKLGLLGTNSTSALNLRLIDPGGDLIEGYKPETNAARPLIDMVANALEGDDGVSVIPSRDYRGVPVVGAWRWLPELGFGVVTQIDAAEAFRPLHVLQRVFVILFLLLMLCAVGMFLYSYTNITFRRRLTEAQLKLKQLGQYTLEEKIGEGGMGTVYRARHALMRRDTAVKLLSHERTDAASIERFEREVQLTCQLTHPNTIQVYDYGHTPEGIFYYAMEYLRGLDLHELVARYGPQPEGRVVYILAEVCESLAEAHALGLVHRDIKPANVFLCERGGIPDAIKVLDFGLVREYSVREKDPLQLTSKDGFVGTPFFMPPEAFKSSSQVDPRGDIYSLGALGYFLLTRQFVFEGQSAMEIYEKQLTTNPIPPSQRAAAPVTAELEQLLLRCLDRRPEGRPESAVELRRLLLATPHAAEWTVEARTAWWAAHRDEIQAQPGTVCETASPIPTLKIDFDSRVKEAG
jgi:tRNA A-37 threonylcarbamoyl transferase component Bud32